MRFPLVMNDEAWLIARQRACPGEPVEEVHVQSAFPGRAWAQPLVAAVDSIEPRSPESEVVAALLMFQGSTRERNSTGRVDVRVETASTPGRGGPQRQHASTDEAELWALGELRRDASHPVSRRHTVVVDDRDDLLGRCADAEVLRDAETGAFCGDGQIDKRQ